MWEGEPVTVLARTPEVPWGLVIALAAIVAGCLLDRLPARSFYSRRAFEPPVRTYAELERDVAELEATPAPAPPLRGYLLRPGRQLDPPSRRELERW